LLVFCLKSSAAGEVTQNNIGMERRSPVLPPGLRQSWNQDPCWQLDSGDCAQAR